VCSLLEETQTVCFFDLHNSLQNQGYSRQKDQQQYEQNLYSLAKQMETFVNNYWKENACQRGYMVIEMETIFRMLVIGKAKKYYFGLKLVVNPHPSDGSVTISVGKLKITGIELKCRNKTQHLRKLQTQFIILSSNYQMKQALNHVKEEIIKLVHKKVPIDDLVMVNVLNRTL